MAASEPVRRWHHQQQKQPRTFTHAPSSQPNVEERPIFVMQRAQGCPGSCEGMAHRAITCRRVKAKSPKSRARATCTVTIDPNTYTRQWPQRFCGIYPRHAAAAPSAKHDTNNTPGNGRFCGIYSRPQSRDRDALHHRPNTTTTQTTHPATAATILRNLPTTPTNRCCTIGQTRHKQHTLPATAATILRNLPTHPQRRAAPAPSPQTQHKQKPATAATIVRNLPTHPQSRCTARAQTQTQTKNNLATAATIMRNFRTVDTKSQASKNVLKTSFSKGELGTPVPLSLRCRAGLSPARHSSLLSPFRLVA